MSTMIHTPKNLVKRLLKDADSSTAEEAALRLGTLEKKLQIAEAYIAKLTGLSIPEVRVKLRAEAKALANKTTTQTTKGRRQQTAILGREKDREAMVELFTPCQFFPYGTPKVEEKFDRIIVAFDPDTPEEKVWVNSWTQALKSGGSLSAFRI